MRATPTAQRFATLALLLGLIVACGPVAVEVAAPTDAPAKKKSTKPRATASASPPAPAPIKPSASPSPSPSQGAAGSPSPPPTSPTASTTPASQAPSASPTASAAASVAPPTGDWSGTPSEAEVQAFTTFVFEPVGRSWVFDSTAEGAPLPPSDTTWTVKAVSADGATVEIASSFETKSKSFPRTAPAATYTKERITVPAGTFDTLKYETTEAGAPVKTWLAKDTGPVQIITSQSLLGSTITVTLKLKSFKPTP